MAWFTKINLRKCLQDEEETPQAVLKAAQAVKQEIGTDFHAQGCLGNAADTLVERTQKAVDADLDYLEVCSVFNGHLTHIYDLADEYRIWTHG
jgi:hypothetical protein